MDNAATDVDVALTDLGPLAWVLEELRKAVGGATRALRRFVLDAEGLTPAERESADTSQLRIARQQLHQAAGAMDMVGQEAPARILRAMEAAVQQCLQHPDLCTDDATSRLERASFGLLQYLEAVLQGKPVSPISLFPQYRDVQALAAQDRAHPADLWLMEWRWNEPVLPGSVKPLPYDPTVRNRFEQAMLKAIKTQDAQAARLLRNISAGFAMAQTARQPRVFWKICAGFFEALSLGLCPNDVHIKRAGSRILQQYTALVRGELGVPDRLAQDLVFFCAQAQPPADVAAPVLQAVREAFGMGAWQPVDYENSPFGRFDPAVLLLARKRIGAAKEAWSSVAGGDLARLRGLADQFSLVSDSLTKLHPPSTALASALTQVAELTVRAGVAPAPGFAMEVATAVMFLEAAFEELDPADATLTQRTARLAERLQKVEAGGNPEPLEPWIEELYRRVSDRQTMGSVVGELRTALGDLERALDQYFRNPKDTSLLTSVPAQLTQMRGVMSVLGLDHAVRAVLRMRDTVEQLMVTPFDAGQVQAAGTFDKLGNNLGALGLLFDMLSYQPTLAKKLFLYDDAHGELRPLMGRAKAVEPSAPETPALHQFLPTGFGESSLEALDQPSSFDSPQLAPAEFQTSQGFAPTNLAPMEPLQVSAGDSLLELPASMTLENENAGALVPVAEPASAETPADPPLPTLLPASPPLPATDEDDLGEDDLLGIFLDEALEVVRSGTAAVVALADSPSDVEQQTVLRRAFHTLKGSSRMVGLTEFGEAAWSLEQLLNTWLADRRPATHELRVLSQEALTCFAQWAQDIAQDDTGRWNTRMFQAAADALRLENRLQAIRSPVADLPTAQAQAEHFAEAMREVPSLELPEFPEAADVPEEATPPSPQALPLQEPERDVSADSFGDEFALDDDVLSPADINLEFPAVEAAPAPADKLIDLALPENAELDLPSLAALTDVMPAELVFEEVVPEKPAPETLAEADIEFDLADLMVDEPGVSAPAVPPAPVAEPAVDVEALDEPEWVFDVPQQPEVEQPAAEPATPVQEDQDALDAQILAEFDAEVAAQSPAQPELTEPMEAVEPAALTDIPAPPVPEAGLAVEEDDDEQVKLIGGLRISIPLYNVYLNEADEWSRRLLTELSEWELELDHRPLSDSTVSLAHSLAGSSSTVGFQDLSGLARELEHAMQWTQLQSAGTPQEGRVYTGAAEDIRRLLHQFAAGFLKEPNPEILDALRQLHADKGETPEPILPPEDWASDQPDLPVVQEMPEPVELIPQARSIPAEHLHVVPDDEDLESVDALDADLFQVFEEEANELMPQLAGALRQWVGRPDNRSARSEVLRVLHTLKGSARLAGAMRLGERAHRMETAIEAIEANGLSHDVQAIEPLMGSLDALQTGFEQLRLVDAQGAEPESAKLALPVQEAGLEGEAAPADLALNEALTAADTASQGIEASLVPDGAELAAAAEAMVPAAPPPAPLLAPLPAASLQPVPRAAAGQAVRIRSQLLDSLVNQTGEVMMTRSRLESGVGQLRASLGDLTGNLERLRQQLRDIELQAELQMQSRLAQTKDAERSFDPLEFDRFTRVQELTRMMAESVNDVATVQRNIERTLDGAEADLVAQARQARELQRDLLRTRMLEFETIAERLYRVVRQASKESGKQVKLDISGGSIEMDRGVLDRMTPAFEHLLRNAVAHGIEMPDAREASGKPAAGTITIRLQQDGNDVSIAFSDDGAGLNRARIREKALALGLITAEQGLSPEDLVNLVFMPGFSTAAQVTELSGRGIGMDVVRSEVLALGGRIESTFNPGQGTHFTLVLPLTTAVTQVVMLRVGRLVFGVPSNVVEQVRRTPLDELNRAYADGSYSYNGEVLPFFWAGALMQTSAHSDESVAKTASVLVLRSAQQRLAFHVDEVLGNQEVVVKNLGPQLSRLPGLSGMTVLASGAVVLIYNPVALASVYGPQARRLQSSQPQAGVSAGSPGMLADRIASQVPLVLVVDDSITVRRVTQRLLRREGYRVALAVDGLQALDQMRAEAPAVVLTDIEMPRMDGFELVRTIRTSAAWKDLPVITISSRTADKHRQMAKELGVNHYLGKPYGEEELLSLIRRYARPQVAA